MRSPVPPKTLSEKSREESCFIATKNFSGCLRRHRRLLHPAKDDRTQPIFYDRCACTDVTRKVAQRGRADVDLRNAKRARRFVEKQLLASSPRVGNLFSRGVACPRLCVGMKAIVAWPLKAVAMAPCARSWMKQKRDAERRPCRDHPD